MARSEARISVNIWSDPEFLALSPMAQRMYLFLLSQADVSHLGVLALRERRWSRGAAGLTAGQVEVDLKELEATGWVVVDLDTEELLLRSYIRTDGVYRQPNVLRSACSAIASVTSALLRAALGAELRQLADEPMPEGSRAILEEMLVALGVGAGIPSAMGSANPSDSPSPNTPGDGKGSRNPSGNPSANPLGDRGVVTAVRMAAPNPSPLSPVPVVPPPAGAAPPRRTAKQRLDEEDNPTAGHIVGEWIEACPKRPPGQTVARIGKSVKAMLAEGIDADDIRRGLKAWASKGLDPSVLAGIVNQVMNASPRHNVLELAPSTAPVPLKPDEVCPEHRGQRKGRCKYCRAAELGVDEP